jgi:NTE family protein
MIVFFALVACTAHYHINQAVTSIGSVGGYSLKKAPYNLRSDELLLILTFSGGGTRAAAFSYGVLRALAQTQVVIDGKKQRLIDEIDVISSVSGGSFTAAYLGLYGDRIFGDFEKKFLKQNIQSKLIKRVLSPMNWFKLGSIYFTRSDLAAELYDELLFEHKTFRDLLTSGGPLIAINATDVALGSQFTFIGRQFTPICTDLLSYPVSRAVTASSAVPGAFPSIILKNYAGMCPYKLPKWATKALNERQVTTRQYQQAKLLNAYLDVKEYPYIHLLDGGVSDNLGIRLLVNATLTDDDLWAKLKDLNLTNTNKYAIITVNAQKEANKTFAKRDYSIPLIDTFGAASSIPLDQYSFETMELLRNNISIWRESITAGRCQEATPSGTRVKEGAPGTIPPCAVQTYLIEVSFDMVQDQNEREFLKSLPTSFHLKPTDVDRLAVAAIEILQNSEVFQALVSDLQ